MPKEELVLVNTEAVPAPNPYLDPDFDGVQDE